MALAFRADDKGILPDRMIAALAEAGGIIAAAQFTDDQIQPASLDLRLGEVAFRVRASFLPGPGTSVADRIAALKLHLPLYWQHIRPIVHQGSVTLEGVVDANYQREEAEGAVRRIRGVVCVVNAIGLAPGAQAVRPEDIKRLIEESFGRSSQRDAGDISVEANGTGVTLRGCVRTWAERSQAERSASSAPLRRTTRSGIPRRRRPSGSAHTRSASAPGASWWDTPRASRRATVA